MVVTNAIHRLGEKVAIGCPSGCVETRMCSTGKQTSNDGTARHG